jgi:hypothetical protein
MYKLHGCCFVCLCDECFVGSNTICRVITAFSLVAFSVLSLGISCALEAIIQSKINRLDTKTAFCQIHITTLQRRKS